MSAGAGGRILSSQDSDLGNEGHVAGDVAAGGGVVSPGQHLEDVKPVLGRDGHREELPSGRSQLFTR